MERTRRIMGGQEWAVGWTGRGGVNWGAQHIIRLGRMGLGTNRKRWVEKIAPRKRQLQNPRWSWAGVSHMLV